MSTSPDRLDTNDWYVAAVSFAGSLLVGCLLAVGVVQLQVLSDPVEVVGRPLLDGYSERSEQLAWLLFAAASLVVPVLVTLVSRRLPVGWIQRAGALAMLLTVPVACSGSSYLIGNLHLPLAIVVMFAAGVIGRRTAAGRGVDGSWDGPLWVVGTVLLIGLHYFPYDVPTVALLIALGCAALAIVKRRRPELAHTFPAIINANRWLILASLPVVVGYLILLPPAYYGWLLLAGLCSWLGRRSVDSPDLSTSLSDPLLMFSLASVGAGLTWLSWYAPINLTLSGGLVVVVSSIAMATTVSQRRLDNLTAWTLEHMRLRLVPRALLLLAGGIAIWQFGWWCGLLLTALLLLAEFQQDQTGSHWSVGLIVCSVILVAFVPDVTVDPHVDRFHDGQILSAVWEVTSGRAVYSDVFPLRSFHFSIAWLSQQVLPPTFESYQTVWRLLTYLPVAAAAGAVFVWTRSVGWAIAAALFAATQPMYPRQGALLLLAALTMQILSSEHRRLWWLLCVPGILSGLYGYDGLGPLTIAAAGAVGLGTTWQLAGFGEFGQQLLNCIRDLAIVLLAMVGIWTLLLLLVVGFDACATYWLLFVDMSGHLNSFFGLALTARMLISHPLPVPVLVLLTLWNVTFVHRYTKLASTRRRLWLFVSLFTVFSTLRAVGRSDGLHFDCLVAPMVLLAVLLLYELVEHCRRSDIRLPVVNSRLLIAVGILLAVCHVEHRPTNPNVLVAQWSDLPSAAPVDLEPDPFVLESVLADESFWPLEDGMATFAHRRHNPTRHAIAYAMSTPGEQRITLEALKANPPRLIAWPQFRFDHPRAPDAHVIDDIGPSLRYYILYPWIHANYRPAQVRGYLQPAAAGLTTSELPDWYRRRIQLKRLPSTWGRHRLPQLRQEADAEQTLTATNESPDTPVASRWTVTLPANAAGFNYLLLKLEATNRPPDVQHWIETTLEVHGKWSSPQSTAMTFSVDSRLASGSYLIPVGCSPDWLGQSEDSTLVIENDRADLTIEECVLLQFEDARTR